MLPFPLHLPEAQPGRAPIILDQPIGLVVGQPGCEILELITIRENGGQADDASPRGIRTTQQALDLCLVTDLPFSQANHVSFVEHHKANVIEQCRIASKSEVELLRCRNDDVSGAKGIHIGTTGTDAAVQARHGLAQRSKGTA